MKVSFLTLLYAISLFNPLFSQSQRGDIRAVFYNVENLFDTINDPITNDDEFTPASIRNWNYYKYKTKLNNTFKVIVNIGEWEPPEIIGLCEIENKLVLEDFIQNTPLYKYQYEIVHYDSPDKRGIDVACLYRKDKLKLIASKPISISNTEEQFYSRDILYVVFTALNNDTLHFFINHWPSRSGGQHVSEPKRLRASEILSAFINQNIASSSNIIIMGDFNDDPENLSIQNLISNAGLKQLSNKNTIKGSLKYQGVWNAFDQILVSKNNELRKCYTDSVYQTASFNYLLEDDNKFSGKKPYRTYSGMKFNNGYSDHLPIFIDIHF